MTQEHRDRNIRLAEALESGKYKQITGRLKTKDGHCCLGVACDLAKEDLGLIPAHRISFRDYVPVMEFGWKEATLNGSEREEYSVVPGLVRDYYGWGEDVNPHIEVDAGDGKGASNAIAAIHNDTGATFAQIAQGFRKLAEA